MNRRDHRNELEAETQVDGASLGSFREILEFLAEHGFAGIAQAMQMYLNEAIQTRGVAFYRTVLERGTRTERALKLAVVEMYLQGVSTRKMHVAASRGDAATQAKPARAPVYSDRGPSPNGRCGGRK